MRKATVIRTAISAVAMVLTLTLNAQTEKVNLVENGSFENGTWGGTGGVIDGETFMDGKSSLKLDSEGKAKFMYATQGILASNLKPATDYILSMNIKRTNSGKGSVYGAVLIKKADEKDWSKTFACVVQDKAGEWTHSELKFKIESDVGQAIIILYNINTEGIVWYDNVSLVEVK